MSNTYNLPIRLELPFVTGSNVNVYLIREPEPVLIDAGYNSVECWNALQTGLAEHGLTAADLSRLIVTHPHVDHYGLAAKITHAGNAEVWMCETGVEWLRNFEAVYQRRIDYHRDQLLPGLGISEAGQRGFMQWMEHALHSWEPIPAERIVDFAVGTQLQLGGAAWNVIHTPGHDATIAVFHQPESRQLIASDALLIPTPTPVVETPPIGQPRQPSLPRMIESFQRLAQLDVDVVYTGHGEPFGNHKTVIANQIARIHQRKEECCQQIRNGAVTVAELFQRMYGAPATVMGMAGLWMALGYVDLLVAEGRVEMRTEEATWMLSSV